jgi:hypothetical protein
MEHKDVEAVARRATRALEVLGKWRSVFAGWQLGTRNADDGPTRAVKHHRELSMMLRVEVNALTKLLLDKGIITQVELTEAIGEEAEALSAAYAELFPGLTATEQGIHYDIERAGYTMRRLGFPP